MGAGETRNTITRNTKFKIFMEEIIKNEYFAKKEQKEKEERAKERSRQTKKAVKFLIWLVIIGWVGLWVYKAATKEKEPMPWQFFEAQSREHINVGAQHPPYNSNPPSGGWHYAVPAKTGIYDIELPDEQIVHNLEHGHIWFAYKPELAKEQIDKLAEIAKDYGSRIIMTPRAANDSPIAIVAWQYVYKIGAVDQSTEPKIRAFIAAYRNIAGPERNIPDNDFQDWRGKATPTPGPAMHNN